MNIMKTITSVFGMNTAEMLACDPTQYKIVTNTNEYVGRIIYQDDFAIKFINDKAKPVKILKSNISRIHVLIPNYYSPTTTSAGLNL